jgi:hypothetical protein
LSQITVQLKNNSGEVVEEKHIVVREGDKLIMEYPDNMSIEKAHSIYKTLLHSLENSSAKMIGIPKGITFQVISIKQKY